MTEIAFHFNAADKLAYACRLLRKAQGAGSRVVATGEPATLQALDAQLWTFSPLDFVAHCMHERADERLLASTPVLLSGAPQRAPHQQVLVNLGEPVPEGFEAYERLIEVVGSDESDLRAGRLRWRHYAERGYALTRHDLRQAH